MFIRGKPIRFGFKVWALCSTAGYPFSLQLYGGAADKTDEPLGTRVVRQLLEAVGDPAEHTVYFDNFFTSHTLLIDLKEKGWRATGTVRDNRTNRCPLKPVAEMKKLEKGEMDYRSDGTVMVCRWRDNAVVSVASNFESVLPIGKAKRWVAKEKKRWMCRNLSSSRVTTKEWEVWM